MRSLGDSDPRHAGPYRLLAGLGADEMGLVLLGRAPDGRLAVVKLVSAHLAADHGFVQRFAGEVAALRQVSGRHIVRVVDAGPGEGTLWVASEFLPGLSMRQVIERGVLLGEDSVLRLAAGLVGALSELHRAGLAHRDLTPANVLLTEDSVRVLDFGIARAVDHDVSQVVGAAEFLSPEQAGGQPVTPASDVFSLGALLHLAATGRSLFAEATRTETLTRVMREQPELSTSLPPRIGRLLALCLAREPGRRPTLDQLPALIWPIPPSTQPWPAPVRALLAEQQAEVARLLEPDPPTVRFAPVARRKARASRRKPDTWAIVSGVAVVVAVVFAIVMFNALGPDQPVTASEQESSAAAPTTSTTTTESATATTTTTTATTTTTTTTRPVPSGQVIGLAGKCMDIAGANTGNGTPVQIHACNGTDAQKWTFALDGTVRSLGKCLDVSGGATNDGAKVQIHDCNGSGAQQWVATSEGWIINVQANKCLDIPHSATDDGTQLTIWTCHGKENQNWAPPA